MWIQGCRCCGSVVVHTPPHQNDRFCMCVCVYVSTNKHIYMYTCLSVCVCVCGRFSLSVRLAGSERCTVADSAIARCIAVFEEIYSASQGFRVFVPLNFLSLTGPQRPAWRRQQESCTPNSISLDNWKISVSLLTPQSELLNHRLALQLNGSEAGISFLRTLHPSQVLRAKLLQAQKSQLTSVRNEPLRYCDCMVQ